MDSSLVSPVLYSILEQEQERSPNQYPVASSCGQASVTTHAAIYGLVCAGAPQGKLIGGEWMGRKCDLLDRYDPLDGSLLSALSSKGNCVPYILSLGHLDVFTLGDQSFALTDLGFDWRSPNSD